MYNAGVISFLFFIFIFSVDMWAYSLHKWFIWNANLPVVLALAILQSFFKIAMILERAVTVQVLCSFLEAKMLMCLLHWWKTLLLTWNWDGFLAALAWYPYSHSMCHQWPGAEADTSFCASPPQDCREQRGHLSASLSSILDNPSVLSPSSQDMPSSPHTSSVALLWAHSLPQVWRGQY